MCTAELNVWLHKPDVRTFPYDAVVRHYHKVGKHFVRPEALELLGKARDILPTMRGPWPHVQTLASFLSTALDKPDQRYDYPTYLALSLLPMPKVEEPREQAPFARSRCDRLVTHLVTDSLAFELAAVEGDTMLLPKQRPVPELISKRFKHGLRVVRPALARMALDTGLTATEPQELAQQACAAVRSDMSAAERRTLELSVLPVYTAHDEYMFLRVLQSFETTFALLAVQLREVVSALGERAVDRAVHFLKASESAMAESAPLFSMLATMQVESFRTFRQFTEGASAIQSRNYKTVESLCRRLDPERFDSPAYYQVPEVRERVLAGQSTLDDAFQEVCQSGDISEEDRDRLAAGMRGFASALLRWRNTHYRLAVRMLGDATGTGYTEGVPYLKSVRTIPVFRTVEVCDEMLEPKTARTR
jgi:tryptophan 2,3-dioxygenase